MLNKTRLVCIISFLLKIANINIPWQLKVKYITVTLSMFLWGYRIINSPPMTTLPFHITYHDIVGIVQK